MHAGEADTHMQGPRAAQDNDSQGLLQDATPDIPQETAQGVQQGGEERADKAVQHTDAGAEAGEVGEVSQLQGADRGAQQAAQHTQTLAGQRLSSGQWPSSSFTQLALCSCAFRAPGVLSRN